MTDLTPTKAGWYPDPENPGQDRRWDGTKWTRSRRPTPGAAASATPASAPSAAPAAPAASAPSVAAAPSAAVPSAAPAGDGWVVTNVLALVGFILAIAGTVMPGSLSLVALAGGIVSVFGLRRARELEAAGVASTGRGFALAGVIVGFVGCGLGVLLAIFVLLFAFAFPVLLLGHLPMSHIDYYQHP